MHSELKLLLHYLCFGAITTSIAASYFYIKMLKPGKILSGVPRLQNTRTSNQAFIKICLFNLIILSCIVIIRTNINPVLGTILVHATLITEAILLFEDRLSQKLATYFILIGILSFAEYNATFSLIISVRLLTGRELLILQINYLDHTLDMVIMNFFNILFCFFFVYFGVIVLQQLKNNVPTRNTALLFIPGFFVSLGQGLVLYQEESPWLPVRMAIYILFDTVCILLFFLNLHNIAIQERKHEFLAKQSVLIKQQLDYSNEIENKYRTIRKQNHDIANQLQSLTWMIDSRNYQDACAYLDELISSLD